eukprot:g11700.t1
MAVYSASAPSSPPTSSRPKRRRLAPQQESPEPSEDSLRPSSSLDAFVAHAKRLQEKEKPYRDLYGQDRSNADYYFNSYGRPGIHRDMMSDPVRTDLYKDVILKNAHLFKDKVVLDVGSGSGILSMFAVQAGARIVYACENSDILYTGVEIVEKNSKTTSTPPPDSATARAGRCEDYKSKIRFFKCKAEELPIEPHSVDIIVSEWMGYLLLYESMLDVILDARDKFLKKETGLIFPDRCCIYLAAADNRDKYAERIGRWEQPTGTGLDFALLPDLALYQDAIVAEVGAQALVSTPARVLDIDLNVITKDWEFETDFSLQAVNCEKVFRTFVAWFSCSFTCRTAPPTWSSVVEEAFFHGPMVPACEKRSGGGEANKGSRQHSHSGRKEQSTVTSGSDDSEDEDEIEGLGDSECGAEAGGEELLERGTGNDDTEKPTCHVEVLNTSPVTPMTHWRQIVYFLKKHEKISEGDRIDGKFSLKRAGFNYRDMEMKIEHAIYRSKDASSASAAGDGGDPTQGARKSTQTFYLR